MQQHAADAVEIAKRAAAEMRAVGVISSDIESPRRDDIPAVSDPREFGEMADTGAEGDSGSPTVAPNGRLTQPLKLTYFDDCSAFAQKRWILKGVIARGETSAWVAPPGAGKSALLTEISVHCAAQIDWRGHRAKMVCGVVIFALERGDLFKRRLQVYRQRDGLHGLPIAVADAVIDLLHPNCVETIVSTVREAEQRFDCSVGLIGIDTYAKGIAANGGDEDKARDQNRAAANLRNVHARLDVHIALVGHTGKDESRGARGSNAHLGDVDVMVQISGDTIKVAQVVKGNDQPERAIAEFKLEAFELGRDEDGDPITTSIVSTDHFETGPTTSTRKDKKGQLKPIPKAALHALFECIADKSTPPPADPHVPAGVTGVTMTIWRNRLQALSIINSETGYRQQFKRIHVTLKQLGFIGIWEDFVWPVT
jgi:AAA domain